MISVEDKYKVRPITKSMAQHNFEFHDEKVLAIVEEDGKVIAVKIFFPQHHLPTELLQSDFKNAKWFADWE